MLEREQVGILFTDARVLYADALEQVDLGKLRNAAEKAWDATLQATNALILARTGQEPQDLEKTDRMIRQLALDAPSLRAFVTGYGSRQGLLLEACVYDGICDPEDDLMADIRDTIDYIQTAETLSQT